MPLAYAQKALALHNCARVWCPWVHAKCVRTARTFARLPRLTSTCTRATQGSEICPEHSCASIRHVCGCLACLNARIWGGIYRLDDIKWTCMAWKYLKIYFHQWLWLGLENVAQKRFKPFAWQGLGREKNEFSKMLSIDALAKHNIWWCRNKIKWPHFCT